MEKVYFGSPVFVYLPSVAFQNPKMTPSQYIKRPTIVLIIASPTDNPNPTRPRLSFSGLFDGRRSIRGDRESLLGSFNQIMKFITYIADDIPSHYQISYLIWKRATETPHKRPRRRGDQ